MANDLYYVFLVNQASLFFIKNISCWRNCRPCVRDIKPEFPRNLCPHSGERIRRFPRDLLQPFCYSWQPKNVYLIGNRNSRLGSTGQTAFMKGFSSCVDPNLFQFYSYFSCPVKRLNIFVMVPIDYYYSSIPALSMLELQY